MGNTGEDKLRDDSEYAQNIVNTVREPLVVLDDKFRVISTNRSFSSTFKVTPEMSENTMLFDLGNRQWDIPKLRELLEEVLPKSTSIEDFEVEHDFPAIGRKTMLLNARRIQSKTGATQILLAIEDITERKRLEDKLRDASEYAQNILIQLVEGLPVAVLLIDAGRKPSYANSMSDSLLGKGIKGVGPEVKAGRWSEVYQAYVAGTDRLYPRDRLPFERALAGDDSTVDDIEIRRADKTVPIGMSAAPVFDESGNVIYAVAVFTDISERLRAQEDLRTAEEKYRGIVENAVEGIYQSTPGGRFIMVNPALVTMWGFNDADEMVESIGDIAQQYVDSEKRSRLKALLEERGIVSGFEAEIFRKDGEKIWISISARAVRDEKGEVRYFEGTIEDITERKRAREALRRTNAELDDYAHTVSHDLKGPLSAVYAASETLRALLESADYGGVPADVKEVARIIGQNVEKANVLIEDLLVLAEAGQEPKNVVDVDVAEVVKSILEERAPDIESRKMKVEVAGDLGRLRANRTHLYQVFSNLIGNTIKHNESTAPVLKIESLGVDEMGCHRYRVRDNGSNLDNGTLEKVFTPFFKGKKGETGLGLTIVEKIINTYKGYIKTYNDEGPCFEFAVSDWKDN